MAEGCYRQENLAEKFGISKLNVGNRSFAGSYIDGVIYLCNEHIRSFSEYKKKHTLDSLTQLLYFILSIVRLPVLKQFALLIQSLCLSSRISMMLLRQL